MKEPKAPKIATPLEKWEQAGVPCFYVRFHQPVPPAKDLQPVSEFNTRAKDAKYLVDSISYTPYGVIFRFKGEVDLVPLANIIYARSVA